MINFREIFNPSYTYIGPVIIILLILLICLLLRDFSKSSKVIGKIILTSGIITLGFALITELLINNMISYNYKLFIKIISDSLFKNLLLSASVAIILGICLLIFPKLKKTNREQEKNMV